MVDRIVDPVRVTPPEETQPRCPPPTQPATGLPEIAAVPS
jgi:hypothetical protein